MERPHTPINYRELAFSETAVVVGLEAIFQGFDHALYDKRIESLKVPYAVESALVALVSNVNEYLLEPDPRADDVEPHGTEEPKACLIDHYTPKVVRSELRARVEEVGGTFSGEESMLGGKHGRYKL